MNCWKLHCNLLVAHSKYSFSQVIRKCEFINVTRVRPFPSQVYIDINDYIISNIYLYNTRNIR